MSAPLTVSVNTEKGMMRFSRALFLGSAYSVTFEGQSTAEGASNPYIVVYSCCSWLPQSQWTLVAATTEDSAELSLSTQSLLACFAGPHSDRSFHAFVYQGEVCLASGMVSIAYSPVDVSSGETVSIHSMSDQLADHIGNTRNPHNVGYAQVGAAAASHTHTVADITDYDSPLFAIDGSGERKARMKLLDQNGVLLPYFEEI